MLALFGSSCTIDVKGDYMAFIFDLGLPAADLEAIGTFVRSEGESDIPELTGDSAKVLEAVTGPQDPNSLWRTVVGRFVSYEELEERAFLNPEGKFLKHADLLYADSEPTGDKGTVEPDFEQPTGAYYIGVPL